MRSVVGGEGTVWECRTMVAGVSKSSSSFAPAVADGARDHAVVACRAADRVVYLDLPMHWAETLDTGELLRAIEREVARGAVYPATRS